MLYEVTHCLGLSTTNVGASVMHLDRLRFSSVAYRDFVLGDVDAQAIEVL